MVSVSARKRAGRDSRKAGLNTNLISIAFAAVTLAYALAAAALCALFPSFGACLCAATLLLLAMFRRPKVGLVIAIAFLPVTSVNFSFWKNSDMLPLPAYVAVIALGFFIAILSGGVRLPKSDEMIVMYWIGFCLAAWAATSLFWVAEEEAGIGIVIELLAGMLMCLLLPGLVATKRDFRSLLPALLIIGILLAVATLVSRWYTGKYLVEAGRNFELTVQLVQEKGRAAGFTGTNTASIVLNLFVFLSLILFFWTGTRRKMAVFGGILFLILVSMVTGSKSGFASLMAGLMMLVAFAPNLKGRRLASFAVLFLTVGCLFLATAYLTTGSLTTTRVVAVGTSFSYSTRLEWWRDGFISLAESAGLGVGAGGYREIIAPIYFAHNLFLSVLFDLGIIGMAIFIALLLHLLVSFRRHIVKTKDADLRMALACMAIATMQFLLNNLLQGDYYEEMFWLLLALDMTLIHIARLEAGGEVSASGALPAEHARRPCLTLTHRALLDGV